VQKPVQITFRDFEPSDAVTEAVHEKAAKLEQFYDRITECHVTIAAPHKHQHKGRVFHVRLHLHLPGKEIVVDHEPERSDHEDVYVAIRDAFEAAQRQLKTYAEKARRDRRHG